MKVFTDLWGQEKHTGEIEAEEKLLVLQAHPLVSIFLDKTPKSEKKVSSLIQMLCAHISCNPPFMLWKSKWSYLVHPLL